MKQLIFGLLGLGALACQPQDRPAQVVAPPPAVVAAPVAAVAPAASSAAAPVAAVAEPVLARLPLSAAATATLLKHHNLADLWKGKASEREEPPLDGFFGTDYRRISFAFTELRPDSLNPKLFHVIGKTRYFKTITPFTGEVRLNTVARLRPRHGGFDALDVDSLCRVYTATASFSFREDSTVAGAGSFAGTAHLDFYLDAQHQLQLAQAMGTCSNMPTLGTGVLYKGRWTSYQGNLSRPLLLSRDVFAVAPPALTNFALGDRDPSFNPKYAKLGWNNYWENKEWWADSPKPRLSL